MAGTRKSRASIGTRTPTTSQGAKKNQVLDEIEVLDGPPAVSQIRKRSSGQSISDEEGIAGTQRPSKVLKTQHYISKSFITDHDVFLRIGTTQLRVYSRTLARESPFFDLLFRLRDKRELPESLPSKIGSFDALDIAKSILEKKFIDSVDGIDVFTLDPLQGPCVEDLMTLLKALDAAIEYVHHPPDLNTVAQIYRAASFYGMWRYEEYCATIWARQLYEDDIAKITEKPLEIAAMAVRLARFDNLRSFRRRAFYDLAREECFSKAQQKRLLQELEPMEFIALLNLQKHLFKAWDTIPDLSYPRNKAEATCSKCKVPRHVTTPSIVLKLRSKLPFDPLGGIRLLLEKNWKEEKFYCADAAKSIRKDLEECREAIWVSINEWIEVDIDDPVSA